MASLEDDCLLFRVYKICNVTDERPVPLWFFGQRRH